MAAEATASCMRDPVWHSYWKLSTSHARVYLSRSYGTRLEHGIHKLQDVEMNPFWHLVFPISCLRHCRLDYLEITGNISARDPWPIASDFVSRQCVGCRLLSSICCWDTELKHSQSEPGSRAVERTEIITRTFNSMASLLRKHWCFENIDWQHPTVLPVVQGPWQHHLHVSWQLWCKEQLTSGWQSAGPSGHCIRDHTSIATMWAWLLSVNGV